MGVGKNSAYDEWRLNEQSSDEEHFCSKLAIKKGVKYYLQNTTLHGLKYIAEDNITTFERVFFGLAFVLVVILSGFFISNIYVRWSASPIIITTSAKQSLTTKIPFPAITICNLNLASNAKVQNISKQSSNFSLLMSLCDLGGDSTISYIGTWKYFKAILIEVAQPCERMLLYCSFGGKPENCSMLFSSVLTDEGLCCTFNALDSIYLLRNFSDDNNLFAAMNNYFVPMDWTPEKGYDKDLPEHFYPRISGGTGSRMGLTVILNSFSKDYYCSKSKSVGFKVLVHNPAELPKISNYGFLVTAGREARVPIEPVYQNAMPSIRSIKKEVRRCLFSDEGDLIYYRTYSRKNCELECEAKILMEKCSCVLYYLPRIDPMVRICGPNDNTCTNQVQSVIESSDGNVSCANCWPACFELNYRATLTSTTIVYGSFLSADDYPPEIFDGNVDVSDMSILHFYYLTNTFRSTTKSEMFGFTEFLSNTGGLLGLFMGFSIFSLIELVYYVTVRPYCAGRTMEKIQRKRKAAGECDTAVKGFCSKSDSNTPYWMVKASQKKSPINTRIIHKRSLRNILLEQERMKRAETFVYPYIH